MFKKALREKPSAPLRNSDRKKFKASIATQFLSSTSQVAPREDADLLVPDGLRSAKFTTSHEESGTLYLSPDGDPLWFTLRSDPTIIPTVYTLWKLEILPILTTPSAAIEKVLGGADLMIPGVFESIEDGNMPSIPENGLVAVGRLNTRIPLAVGRMALDSKHIDYNGKGKAVYVLHTWKDTLWEIGNKPDPPSSIPEPSSVEEADPLPAEDLELSVHDEDIGSTSAQPTTKDSSAPADTSMTSQEADTLLRDALLHTIAKMALLPPGSFPLSSSTFYSAHLLPSRPASSPHAHTPDLIKRSSYKKLGKFLQSAEKSGLLTSKDFKGDLNVLSVNATHPDVESRRSFKTIGEVDAKEAKVAQAAAQTAAQVHPMVVTELYKPHAQSLAFFDLVGKPTKDTLYSAPEVRAIMDEYISSHSLIHPREPTFITPDDALRNVLLKKNETADFLPRSETITRLVAVMQPWYAIQPDGKEVIIKKGELHPISVTSKIRQGRKASTFVTNFEPFLLSAEFLSEELRKSCASATSINPLPGKSAGLEVHVQGKQIKAVVNLLLSQGVPKKWIEASDLTATKKK